MRAISQEIRHRKKLDFYTDPIPENIIWEENRNYGMPSLFIGILFIFFGIIIAPIGLIIFLPFGLLLIYYPKRYLIQFTDSYLIIRKRLLRKARTFEYVDLYKVEIIIKKRKVYYHSDSGTYNAFLKFKIKIFTSSKDYKYSFTWIFYQRKKSAFKGYKEAKEEAIKKREAFGARLIELEKIFPYLITLTDDFPVEKELKHEKRKLKIFYSLSFILILVSLLASNLRNDAGGFLVSIIEMILLFILIKTNKFNKVGEALIEQKDKSIKSIMKLIVISILAIFFVLILVSILGYVLLFLLELFILIVS